MDEEKKTAMELSLAVVVKPIQNQTKKYSMKCHLYINRRIRIIFKLNAMACNCRKNRATCTNLKGA